MAIDKAWTNLRERQAERGTRAIFDELPVCQICHDHGYWTIRYPLGGYEAIHLCNCKKAHERWGSKCYEEMDNRPEDLYWDDMRMYFGGKNKAETRAIMSEYELVTLRSKYPKDEVVMEYRKKGVT